MMDLQAGDTVALTASDVSSRALGGEPDLPIDLAAPPSYNPIDPGAAVAMGADGGPAIAPQGDAP